jgi:hypothetical protein
MVGHEAVGVAEPMIPFIDMLEGVQEVQAVGVVFEEGLLLIAAGRDVIDCAGVFDAERTGHGATIAEEGANCKEKDLTLLVLKVNETAAMVKKSMTA